MCIVNTRNEGGKESLGYPKLLRRALRRMPAASIYAFGRYLCALLPRVHCTARGSRNRSILDKRRHPPTPPSPDIGTAWPPAAQPARPVRLAAVESFPYLGVRASPIASRKRCALSPGLASEKDLVFSATRELARITKDQKYLLSQIVPTMHMVPSSRFRYSAPLVPWAESELEDVAASAEGSAGQPRFSSGAKAGGQTGELPAQRPGGLVRPPLRVVRHWHLEIIYAQLMFGRMRASPCFLDPRLSAGARARVCVYHPLTLACTPGPAGQHALPQGRPRRRRAPSDSAETI